MGKTLGLDLGTNSVGWALIDREAQKILKTGVRVFPAGVENPSTSKEESKNAKRRSFRQARRQTYRRRLRKIALLSVLIRYEMCPLKSQDLVKWKNYKKDVKRQFPDTPEFNSWLAMNPYELRDRALNGEINRNELGRILYSFIQRRGFKTGRKSKPEGKIYEGKDTTIGINSTKDALQDGSTLGEYLYREYKEHGSSIRVRNRYTLRQWYIDEFERIWEKQADKLGLDGISIEQTKSIWIGNINTRRAKVKIQQLERKNVSYNIENGYLKKTERVTLHEYLGDPEIGLLFFQLPLRSQKHLLAPCRFEPGKKPCPLSHPDYEEFRYLQIVNNIRYVRFGSDEKLSEEDRKKLIELIEKKNKSIKIKDIKKILKLEAYDFNYPDEFEIPASTTILQLKTPFSGNIWDDDEKRHTLWHCFSFYDNAELLQFKLQNDYGLLPEAAKKLAAVRLKDGYSNVSLRAIRNMLPFLRRGFNYSDSAFLGGVFNVCKCASVTFDNELEKAILKILRMRNSDGEAVEKVRVFLEKEYKVPGKYFTKLYHHSQSVRSKEYKRFVPAIDNLRNPIVQQALNETRRVVNAVIERYLDIDEQFDEIRVEIARDLKQSSVKRKAAYTENLRRKSENDEARKALSQYGLAHTRQNVHKYLLYKELENRHGTAVCPYSGKVISMSALFGEENLFQIEHIIPYSISLDDGLGNKTLCESKLNQEKGERTPFQFFHTDEAKWNEIVSRAFACLPYNKAKRFVSRFEYSQGFIERQLNDTRYISRKAAEILKSICPDVRVVPGRVTSELRHNWGLDTVLSPPVNVSDDTEPGDYWAITSQKGDILELQPKNNIPPDIARDELLLTGKVKNGVLFSDSFPESYSFETSENDGRCWFKMHVGQIKSVTPIYSVPGVPEDGILRLRGQADGGRFECSFIQHPISLKASFEGKRSVWVEALIEDQDNIDFIPSNMKSRVAVKNEMKVFGTVVTGHFHFRLYGIEYSIPASLTDGKWIAFIKIKDHVINPVPVRLDKPSIHAGDVCIEGVMEKGSFLDGLNPPLLVENSAISDGPVRLVLSVESRPFEIRLMENEKPKERPENLLEGKVEVHVESGRKQFFPQKNRGDHRHHSIDAVTVAFSNQRNVQKLASYNAKIKERLRGAAERPVFDAPWNHFRNDVVEQCRSIIVSHKSTNRVLSRISRVYKKDGKTYISRGIGVRGQLHKETVFGKRLNNQTNEYTFRVRKPVETLANNKHIEKIADIRIQRIILDLLEKNGIDTKRAYTIPSGILVKDGRTQVYLPNNNGDPIPVRKVRMEENLGNAEELKDGSGQYVNPRNNHHILIYRNKNGDLAESCISFWEAVRRKKSGEKIFQLPPDGEEIEAILKENEFFLIGCNDLTGSFQDYLYRVQKVSSMYYVFRKHTEASIVNDYFPYYHRIVSWKKWEELKPIPVKVDILGEITVKN